MLDTERLHAWIPYRTARQVTAKAEKVFMLDDFVLIANRPLQLGICRTEYCEDRRLQRAGDVHRS